MKNRTYITTLRHSAPAKICFFALCLIILIIATSCGSTDGGSEGALTKVTFCLDWTPNTNYTGIYAAKALGYYEDAGLDVTIVQPPEDGCLVMCASGQAQFAGSAQDSLVKGLDTDDPLRVTAVATILQHNTSGIMSRAGEGADHPGGLEGKRYSTWQDPTELAIIKHLMEADGADYDKIQMIPNDITDEPAALEAKQTDAVWVYYGWSGINAEVEGVDCDYMMLKDFDEVLDYYTPIIVANDDFLAQSPDVARAFLEATARGYEFAIGNPKEAADMLIEGDDTGSLLGAKDFVTKSQEWISTKYTDDAKQWGIIDPDRWNAFYKWLYENELTSRDFSGVGFTNDYLPAVM